MNTIITIRQDTKLVPEYNPYLFAYPNNIRVTSNRLQKQIATVMQTLNMIQERKKKQFA